MGGLTDQIMDDLFGKEYMDKLRQKSYELTNGQYFDVFLALIAKDMKDDQAKLLKTSVGVNSPVGG